MNVAIVPACVTTMSCARIIQEHIDVIVAVLERSILTTFAQVRILIYMNGIHKYTEHVLNHAFMTWGEGSDSPYVCAIQVYAPTYLTLTCYDLILRYKLGRLCGFSPEIGSRFWEQVEIKYMEIRWYFYLIETCKGLNSQNFLVWMVWGSTPSTPSSAVQFLIQSKHGEVCWKTRR
jgi:hypothetical protein